MNQVNLWLVTAVVVLMLLLLIVLPAHSEPSAAGCGSFEDETLITDVNL